MSAGSILIADSGSTKTDWCLVSGGGIRSFQTRGFNPYFLSGTEELSKALRNEVALQIQPEHPDKIYFYGAGCAAEDKKLLMLEGLSAGIKAKEIEVHDDLLGAARGILNNQPGLIFILGTGMNNGLYNGKEITYQVDSLGYLLGDEGSGTAIGKRLLRDYLRNEMPAHLKKSFFEVIKMNRDEIIQHIQTGDKPNRFIASYSTFAAENIQDHYIINLLNEIFTEFFDRIVTRFPSFQDYSFNATGSIGFYFREIISELLNKYGMKEGAMVRSPMEGLIRFHKDI